MFDAEKIATQSAAALLAHYQELSWKLYFAGTMDDIVLPLEDSPIKQEIMLLVDVANGNSHRHQGEVAEALLSVITTFEQVESARLPEEFEEIVQHVQLWLNRDDLITISDAAVILRGGAAQKDIMSVKGYIERGKLTKYRDPRENNPQYATRVSRREVEALHKGGNHDS
jgi:hypothetical protein